MHEIYHIQVGKSQLLKGRHANICGGLPCTEEGHTPPGSPQGKFLLLKIIKIAKENIKNPSEIHQKFQTARKNLKFGVPLEYSNTKLMQKE